MCNIYKIMLFFPLFCVWQQYNQDVTVVCRALKNEVCLNHVCVHGRLTHGELARQLALIIPRINSHVSV